MADSVKKIEVELGKQKLILETGALAKQANGAVLVTGGETVVLQAGREYKELARNKLEEFRSSLVFEGKRVYIRTAKHLYCIGE